MKQIKNFLILGIFFVNGCATLGSVSPNEAAYSNWPPTFQADYLWETVDSKLSMAIQPKWVRFYVQEGNAIRCMAFNFLGATLWDVTLHRAESGAVSVYYRKGKKHPRAVWVTKIVGQLFFDQAQWRGWCWKTNETENESGVLKTLVFMQRQRKRILKLHKVRIGSLEKSLFNQPGKSYEE